MIGNYRYYEDHYGTQYRWYVKKQSDGKFHAEIVKHIVKQGWGHDKTIKQISFSKKKFCRKWCGVNCEKAKAHQTLMIKNKSERKIKRESMKRVIPKEEKNLVEALKKKTHYENLVKKCNTKIKATTTRKTTYEKNLKKLNRKIDKIMNTQKGKGTKK